MICPSLLEGGVLRTDDCNGPDCAWWAASAGCTAQASTEEVVGKFTPAAVMPDCGIESSCMWGVQAAAVGLPGCLPRRMGDTCQHRGGDFNAFELDYEET